MVTDKINNMLKAHEILCSFEYEKVPLVKGYTGKSLRIDIGNKKISINEVSEEMKKLWVGGKGFDLWLMFQEISKDTKWDSPENPICFSSGPLGGTSSFPGSGKTLVTSVSPITQSIMDSNVGGHFGPYMKFSGFDAMVVTGKTDEDVIIYIDGAKGKITIEKAPLESIDSHVLAEELTEMYADDILDRRNISVISAGKGAEYTRMGIMNFSFYDWRRQSPRFKQSGRGGIGTVFRNKKIKAIVIKNSDLTPDWFIEENLVSKLTLPKKLTPQKEQEVEEIKDIIQKHDFDHEYVIEMLEEIQDRFRYISKEAIDTVSLLTNTPRAHVYHIATFYKGFSLEPRGKLVIQVCTGTACHVKGATKIVDSFERELGIKSSETTSDERFTLESVACLGACSLAPVVKIGDDVKSKVKSGDVVKIIKEMEKSIEGGESNE